MKNYIANVFIYKGKKTERMNFTILSESDSEETLKTLIKERVKVKEDKYEFVKDKYEFVPKESLVIYESEWKEIVIEKDKD